jgi:hypothetical protein
MFIFHSPQDLPSLACVHVAQPCIVVTGKATKATVDCCRAWIWRSLWRQTSLLLYLTFQHEEMWLPSLLSMVTAVWLVAWMCWMTDEWRPYVPKRHRKWSRYREECWQTFMVKAASMVRENKPFQRLMVAPRQPETSTIVKGARERGRPLRPRRSAWPWGRWRGICTHCESGAMSDEQGDAGKSSTSESPSKPGTTC